MHFAQKVFTGAVLIAGILSLSACVVQTEQPLFDESVALETEELVGTWQSVEAKDVSTFTFEPHGDYSLLVKEDGVDDADEAYIVNVLKVGNTQIIERFMEDEREYIQVRFSTWKNLAGTFMKIELLNSQWFEENEHELTTTEYNKEDWWSVLRLRDEASKIREFLANEDNDPWFDAGILAKVE